MWTSIRQKCLSVSNAVVDEGRWQEFVPKEIANLSTIIECIAQHGGQNGGRRIRALYIHGKEQTSTLTYDCACDKSITVKRVTCM
ncbi:hypothetical protein Bhyg_02614, partial [Pseudolycoriella hygida]